MSVRIEPLTDLTDRAKRALMSELGAVDAMRFLNQFRTGSGDYTVERETLLAGESVTDIVTEIKARRGDRP